MTRKERLFESPHPQKAMNLSLGRYHGPSSNSKRWDKNPEGGQYARNAQKLGAAMSQRRIGRDRTEAAPAYSYLRQSRYGRNAFTPRDFSRGDFGYGSRYGCIPTPYASRTPRACYGSSYSAGGYGEYGGYESRGYRNRAYGRSAWPSYQAPRCRDYPPARRYQYYDDATEEEEEEYGGYYGNEGGSYNRPAFRGNNKYYDDGDEEDEEEDDEFDDDYDLEEEEEYYEPRSRWRPYIGYGRRRDW